MQIELSDRYDLLIIMIVFDNHDNDGIQSYYRDVLDLSMLCKKICSRSKHDSTEVKSLVERAQ